MSSHYPQWSADAEARILRERSEQDRMRYADSRRRALKCSNIVGHLQANVAGRIVADTLEETEYVKAAADWYERRDKPVLLLCGSIGTGKTVAAASILAKCGGQFHRAHRLLRVFGNKYGSAMMDRQDAVLRCRLLVVDDVGVEDKSDRKDMEAALLEIIDARVNTEFLTIITTNLFVTALHDEYKETRLHSRLAQSAEIVEFKGADRRRGGPDND